MAFFLAGCGENNGISRKLDGLVKKVDYLSARIAAVEEACRQLDARLAAVEDYTNDMHAATDSKPVEQKTASILVAAVAPGQPKAIPESMPRPSPLVTKGDIMLRIKGKSQEEVKKELGRPDTIKKTSTSLSWNYNSIAFKLNDGSAGSSGLLVVFENGEEAKQIFFHENVKYKTKSNAR